MNDTARKIPLKDILASFPVPIELGNIPQIYIYGVTADSRTVIPGSIFIACPGQTVDGHDFIGEAVQAGAVIVVGEKKIRDCKVPYITVDNSRKALAYLSAAFYDNPARKLIMIGVTGTDGKTTTTNLIYAILKTAGFKVGMISTVNAIIGDKVVDTGFHVTTPDSPEIQYFLHLMVEAGITHIVLETTSHGWAQYRVDACEFDVGVITNITHEHLDQHGSFDNYQAAKARLFSSLAETQRKGPESVSLAVLNKDDPSYELLKNVSRVRTASYSLEKDADFIAEEIYFKHKGTEFLVRFLGSNEIKVTSNLVGLYNISNCLAAFSVGVAGLGIAPELVSQGIASLEGVPGRMERIESGQQFTAIVDFAHTPNALKVALQTARELTNGNVIAVLGSAGLRDREKRRLMAETSIELADISIFTAEDPRTESLELILNEMKGGALSKGGTFGKDFWCIQDRGNAIRKAIELADPKDLVICFGKGHEQSMCFGTIEYAWDDRTALRAAIADYLGIKGPKMPFLPTQDGSHE